MVVNKTTNCAHFLTLAEINVKQEIIMLSHHPNTATVCTKRKKGIQVVPEWQVNNCFAATQKAL